MSGLCRLAGISRQHYYKAARRREARQHDESLALELARAQRQAQPRLGGRKLLALVNPGLDQAGVPRLGRNRFYRLLASNGMLVPGRRRRAPRTTDSRHMFKKCPNLLKDAVITGPNQAWVSDLTYLSTREGFVYLSLIMDVFSRKIVGWNAGNTLEASGCLKALKMAIASLPPGAAPLHHSDRGVQYCCREYARALRRRGLRRSMTWENHCYENAQAERLNGILKQEYGLGHVIESPGQARQMAAQAVDLYDTRRPHQALGYRTPDEVHRNPQLGQPWRAGRWGRGGKGPGQAKAPGAGQAPLVLGNRLPDGLGALPQTPGNAAFQPSA